MRHLMDQRLILDMLTAPVTLTIGTRVPIQRILTRRITSDATYTYELGVLVILYGLLGGQIRRQRGPTISFEALYR